MRAILAAIIILFYISSCDSGKKPDESKFLEQMGSEEGTSKGVSSELIEGFLQQIPSPLEISVLLKESGARYNKTYLNDPSNSSKYNTNYLKALNLGIYGADLGYTNIYEQNQDGIQYLNSINELANGLNIGQFFDIETIRRLATHSKNLDSLLLITTRNFNDINDHLSEQGRANLSILLLTGGWLEALHISCQVAKANPGNVELKERIGEQKLVLEQILSMFDIVGTEDDYINRLHTKLKELERAFANVEMTTTYGESKVEVRDGVAYIVNDGSSSIVITDEDIEKIRSSTQSVRERIVI